ncbi:hypothetical protein DRQ32_11715, partial [bacterium]
ARALSIFSLCFLLNHLAASAPLAATLQTMEVEQLTFENEGGVYSLASSLADLVVVYDAGPIPQYLNMQAKFVGSMDDPVWVVRNVLLHDLSYEPPVEEIAARIHLEELGHVPETELFELLIGFTVTDTPVYDVDFAAWSVANPANQVMPVAQSSVVTGASSLATNQDTITSAAPNHATHTPAGQTIVYAHRGCTIPNLDLVSEGSGGQPQDWNGCVPAACANSLHWLRGQHHPAIDFPQEHREIFEHMNRLMNRNPPYKGVDAKTTARAKMDFIEAYGLPIRVKYQSAWDTGNVKSSSGASTAQDQDTGPYPTKEWLQQEAANGEDVEVNVSWLYKDGNGVTHWDGSHAVTLTGMGVTSGKPWIKFKDDQDQLTNNPRKLRHKESDLIDVGGALHVPGLDQDVQPNPPSGPTYKGTAYITSAVSESYDPSVQAPSTGKHFDRYCSSVKRTIPAGGKMRMEYPNEEDRCYNTTLYVIDRTHTPPKRKRIGPWNNNRGKTFHYHNPYPYPVTIELHNDDNAGGRKPYPGYTMGIHVIQPPTTSRALLEVTPLPNPETYGGFSLGADDGSWEEFSPVDLGPLVTVGPIVNDMYIDVVPSHLGELVATTELLVSTPVPAWNQFWEHLGLLVDVAVLVSPGDLFIECPSTGFVQTVSIAAAGRYEFDLGIMPSVPNFDLRLVAQNGLEFYLDCLGVPSMVEGTVVDAPPDRPAGLAYLGPIRPNPFNPQTNIHFYVPSAGDMSLAVYDIRGRRIRSLHDGHHDGGEFDLVWDGRDDAGRPVASGSYLCRMEVAGQVLSEKLTLVR